MKKLALGFFLILWSAAATAVETIPGEYLVQINPDINANAFSKAAFIPQGSKVSSLGFNNWVHIQVPKDKIDSLNVEFLSSQSEVNKAQNNRIIRLFANEANPYFQCPPGIPKELCDIFFPPGDGGGGGGGGGGGTPPKPKPGDNPDFPSDEIEEETEGADPEFSKQWGMEDIEVLEAFKETKGSKDVVVAVIDTGVDYTHDDLKANIWRHPGETGTDADGNDKATNGIDDDGNGFIDDAIGWDFARDDNKPYDVTSSANPGHGTHCAGNIAARYNNSIGITGVAPNVKLMPIRIFSEDGQTSEAAILKALTYAIDNGATLASNSWGGVTSKEEALEDQAFVDVFEHAEKKGVLMVFAAGNGDRIGRGFENTDKQAAYPASYENDIILSVAALSKSGKLTSFSNWGETTVDIGAPGGGIYSTIPNNKYMNMSGTSMATPITAGAAALYWSKHRTADWKEVKEAIIKSAKPVSALDDKVVADGKLDVKSLIEL